MHLSSQDEESRNGREKKKTRLEIETVCESWMFRNVPFYVAHNRITLGR